MDNPHGVYADANGNIWLGGNGPGDSQVLKFRVGVTVLAAKKAYPAFVDETIELHETISVSAGIRGTQIWLAPGDYLRAASAVVAAIARASLSRK